MDIESSRILSPRYSKSEATEAKEEISHKPVPTRTVSSKRGFQGSFLGRTREPEPQTLSPKP